MSTRTRRTASLFALVLAAFVCGVFFVSAGGDVLNAVTSSEAEAQVAPPTTAAIEAANSLGDAFQTVAEAINPAVVQIASERVADRSSMGNPFEGTPFERMFPGQGGDAPRVQSGLGSGVFIRADGHLITNNHVIEGADELTVRLFDGSEYEAEVVGADPFSDLAVLKIDPDESVPFVGYGDRKDIKVGQWVLAFGSPLSENLSNTVTAGIVSALGRTGQLDPRMGLTDFIQTDAAINPGNSGGALINLGGELVGINTAIATRTGGFQGIGFAIPVDVVENTVEQIIESGEVERGFLGISPGPVSSSLARALDVHPGAAQILQVTDGAPASAAGFEVGDVITAVDGTEVRAPEQIFNLIGNRRPGDEVEITYVPNDGGDRRTVSVTLGDRDALLADGGPTRPSPEKDDKMDMEDDLGLSLNNLTQRLRVDFEVPPEVEGVLVTNVTPLSQAARDADLQRGDIIVEANRQPISTTGEFENVYGSIEAGDTFLLQVQRPVRGGDFRTFMTALTKPDAS
ncbi:MAG: trypsin-like peptidase domain-containing protein [Bacteroidota bacterium]